jgi:NAD(P)-dependent dehydrogenase (short-subunit alcohol dehydrogenase family)
MKQNELTEAIYENDQGEGVHRIDAGSRGVIVNMASVSSFIAQPEFCPYNVSKGAILQLTRCTAMDLAKFKIRVNAIAPDLTETPASYNHMKSINLTIEEGRKEFASYCLLKRMCAPDEIANAAYFLASDESSFMTGAMLVIDGGRTL